MLFDIVLCHVVCHIVDGGKTSNPVRNKSDVVIRPDSRGDNAVVLVYLPIIISELHLAEFIDRGSIALLFREEESVISVRILVVVTSIIRKSGILLIVHVACQWCA